MSESSSRPDEIGTLLRGFDARLATRRRSDATREKYRQALSRFEEWLGERPLSSVGPAEVEEFIDWWWQEFERSHGRAPSASTHRNLVAALRAFFGYLEQFDLLLDDQARPLRNPLRHVERPQVEQKPNDWLREDEDERLLAVDCTKQERIIVWLLRWTGLRVSEATSVRIRDLDLQPGSESLYVRESKTPQGRRSVPLVPELLPHLRAWLDYLRAEGRHRPDAFLLSTSNGTAMKSTFIWRIVKRVAARAEIRPIDCTCGTTGRKHQSGCAQSKGGENVSEVTPHTLRRTYASHLINRGLTLNVLSKLLGHKNTSVTENHYAELPDARTHQEVLRVLREDAAA